MSEAALPQGASRRPVRSAADPGAAGRVGPNAVIQLGHALRASHGPEVASAVYARAGATAMLDDPPEDMVSEQVVASLFRALHAELPQAEADAVARDAGARTAEYLLAHRIPGPVRRFLTLLPVWASARLLLRAIAANAWTFAGSGSFSARPGRPHVIEIARNPIPMPGCAWHVAVFAGLFASLVTPRTRVTHPACQLDGASACRFEVACGPPGKGKP